MANPETGFIPPQEGKETRHESIEIDREFIIQGLSSEIQKAQEKERLGEEERWGRATFVAARSHELGISPEIPDEVWQKMVLGLQYKREKKDAWGISFQARYLKEINPERFTKEVAFSEDESVLLGNELTARKDHALKNPKRWTEYYAMASHIQEIQPELLGGRDDDKDIRKGLKECLGALSENDPVQYVHTANSAAHCHVGILQRADVMRSQIEKNIASAITQANEAKEKGDVWLYAFIASQIKGLDAKLP